jgi:uncharacterized protein
VWDGKNLNRSFPGSPTGTLAERPAYDAFTQLIAGSDAYIDAHSGDMVEVLQPSAGPDPAVERAPSDRPGRDRNLKVNCAQPSA